MKIGDLVKAILANGESGCELGIILELLSDDYWGDTAMVWWNDDWK